MARYTVYGNLARRDAMILTTTLVAKGVDFDFVEESASLSLALAARAGTESGPYLRTPEGFVLADLHPTLDWIERAHPDPPLLPTTPIRRTVARLLEDWLALWLPIWPRRSWATLERLGEHLVQTGFLLGPTPSRPDILLASWLELDVLNHDHARAHLGRTAPRLLALGNEILAWSRPEDGSGARAADPVDDVLPISLLNVLSEVADDYHAYLVENHRAIKDGQETVMLDLGLGRRAMPVREICETRRAEIGRELSRLEPAKRRDVLQVLDPVGAWSALTLPPAIEQVDPADPRSL